MSQQQEKKLRHLLQANSVPGTVLHLRWRTNRVSARGGATEGGAVNPQSAERNLGEARETGDGPRTHRAAASPATRVPRPDAGGTAAPSALLPPRPPRPRPGSHSETAASPRGATQSSWRPSLRRRQRSASAAPAHAGALRRNGPIAGPGTGRACADWARLPEASAAEGLERSLVT